MGEVRTQIAIKGMHCSACEKTIHRALTKIGTEVHTISFRTGTATISPTEMTRLRTVLQEKGYELDLGAETATTTPARGHLWALLTTAVVIFAGAFLLQTLMVRTMSLSAQYIPVLLWVPVAVVANVVALWYQQSFREEASCMTGMMIGMTIGMTSGFMIGALSGLMNGMFFGSVVGTCAGIIAGVYAGRCCGTMGIMEGMMAGLMGGTMGAMLTVMMIGDHVLWFIPLLFIVCIAILGGLITVIAGEYGPRNVPHRPWSGWITAAVAIGLMAALDAAIILLPKGVY